MSKKIIFILFFFCTLVSANIFAQWQADVRLTINGANSNIYKSCLAVNGNVLHIVWDDDRDGNPEIYYKRSPDGGVSWGTDTRLTNNSALSGSPSVSVDGSTVHVLWYDARDGNYEIYYKRSTDGGLSWGADTRLTNNSAASWHPCVSDIGPVVYAVWEDLRNGFSNIYYKRSIDAGLTWGADIALTNILNSYSGSPSVFAASNYSPYVVWEDYRDGNMEIYYKHSPDGGLTWASDVRLTNNSASSSSSSIAVSGNSFIHVVWSDNRDGNYEIYYKRSTDGGVSWGTDTRLTNNSAVSDYSSVSVSGSNINVIWYDARDGNNEIYYKRSTDGGVTWGADTRLTNNSGNSQFPGIALSGSVVHAVWQDNRDGNTEIYYKKDPSGNPPPSAAPSGLTATTVSATRINLNWTDNSPNENGFKIERSTNAGTTWILRDSVGQNTHTYSDLGLSGSTTYHYRVYAYNAGGNSGYSNIAFATTLVTGIHPVTSEIPKAYKLFNNYPNPFNPSTKIKFDIPKSSFVKITVYDITGSEVKTLVNEVLQPARYDIEFNPGSLTSGIYFYKLTTNEYTATKKMVLVK